MKRSDELGVRAVTPDPHTGQPPVRYAIVSPARWGRLLLDSVRDSPALQLAGVASRDTGRAGAVAAEYGGRVYGGYDEVLADDGIEAVVLPTPHFLHHRQSMAALAAGKHVFVEKPIANTVDEAVEMRRASEERGLVLAVGMQGRRTGAVRRAKQLLDSGTLGAVGLAVAIHGAPLARGYTDGDWEASDEHLPGGPLDTLGIHYADLMQFLFGPVRRVAAFYTRAVTPLRVPDLAAMALDFDNGTVGSYNTQQVSAYASKLSIYGTEGAVHIDRFGQELWWQDVIDTQAAKRGGRALRAIALAGPDPFSTALTEELEEFAACIRNGGTPETGAAEGIAALRVVRAALESHESGQAVTLDGHDD